MLGNIERFLDLKHELGSPIEADIQIVRLSETDAEVEEFVDRWKQTHADLINIKELDTWGGQIEDVNAPRESRSRSTTSTPTASRARISGTTATSTGTASWSRARATTTRSRRSGTSRTVA